MFRFSKNSQILISPARVSSRRREWKHESRNETRFPRCFQRVCRLEIITNRCFSRGFCANPMATKRTRENNRGELKIRSKLRSMLVNGKTDELSTKLMGVRYYLSITHAFTLGSSFLRLGIVNRRKSSEEN